MKIISVGTNHAGTSFIRTLAKLDANKKMEITTYDRNTNISFLGCGIALWVGGEFKDPKGLFYSDPKSLAKLGVNVKMEHDVVEINQKQKYVMVKNLKTGEIFKDEYDKLVYAGGSWPIVPPFKGVKLENIFLSKLFQHAQAIKAKVDDKNVKDVVIIGAGYIGIELVEAFHQHGKNVTLIDMQDRVIPNYFDKEFTKPLEEKMAKEGIKLQMGEAVKEFIGNEFDEVTHVVTDKDSYKADMVIMAIGARPQTQIIEGNKLPNGAIKVDKRQRSLKFKDTYVVGDCAAMKSNVSNKHVNIALATNAVKTGVVAALDIAGSGTDFPGVTGTNAISVFGFNYSSTGYSEKGAELNGLEVAGEFLRDKDRSEFMSTTNDVSFKITYNPKTLRLIGAQVGSEGTNHTEVTYALSLAIQKKMTIVELALMDVYFLPHFNKPFNFILQTILNAINMKY